MLLETKSGETLQAAVERFRVHLQELDERNQDFLAAHLKDAVQGTLVLADISGDLEATVQRYRTRLLEIWEDAENNNISPEKLASRERQLGNLVAQHFFGAINERRQIALGITHYIWRTRDDSKVRAEHAPRDDKIYSWDHVHEDGHPGQAPNCRCFAEPVVSDSLLESVQASAPEFDGFAIRFGEADRELVRRNAEAELRLLRPAITVLAGQQNKTPAEEADLRALAERFIEAAYRYELAAPGGLASSGLLFGPESEQARLVAEATAYRLGAEDLARGMAESPFFEGTTPFAVLNEQRAAAPDTFDRYLNAAVHLAAVSHLSEDALEGRQRRNVLRNLGARFVAAARGVEAERWGGRPILFRAEVAQWDALHEQFQIIAGQKVSETDGRAVTAGMREETGRRFYPETLAILSGGLLSVVASTARAPIRITRDMLDPTGLFLGARNAGQNAPRFAKWLENPGNTVELMPGGQIRYTTRLDAPSSPHHGQSISVSYTDGVPDFSRYTVARVDIRVSARQATPRKTRDADALAATRRLKAELEAGRVSRNLFNEEQLAAIDAEKARIPGLTWHHDGIASNADGTGPMSLVDRFVHFEFSHRGWFSTVRR